MTIDFDDPWELFAQQLRVAPARPAIRAGERVITYGEVDAAVAALSRAVEPDLAVHDAVGVLLGILPEYVLADLAILRSGLVKVPLNPMLSASEMGYILQHSGTRMLLTSDALAADDRAKVAELRELLPELVIRNVSLDDLLAMPHGAGSARAGIPSTNRAAIYYTGGTTGKPKGVVHTRAGVAATVLAHALEAEIGSDDVLLLSTSLSHSAGSFAHAALARGAQLVLLDRFSPDAFCRVAVEHGATFAMVVPTMLYRLLDHLRVHPEQTPTLHTFVYGSAPITPARLREAIEVFGPVFIQLFGQTECPNWGTSLGKRDHAAALERPELLASCGSPCTLARVRVVDEDGRDLPPGESGEILLSAPYAMAGYWRNEEATAETLRDGWIHTRDVGQWDEDGYLYVRDRKSDMIITGGYNVYSSEVEAELQTIAGVGQVAVIGIPDPDWGEAVCAIVVRDADADELDEAALLGRARELLGAYKRPKKVVFLDEIPLTPFGKADKKMLRAPYWDGAARAV